MHRTLAAVAVMAALMLGAFSFHSSAVHADGAVVTQQVFDGTPMCSSSGPYTFCETLTGEIHITQTPSGNVTVSGNVKGTSTSSVNGTLVSSGTVEDHFHELSVAAAIKELGNHLNMTDTAIIGGMTCTFTLQIHFAGGQFQFDNETFTCSP